MKITIESGDFRFTLEGESIRLKVAPDDETAAKIEGLRSQGDRIEKGLIAMSQLVQDLQASLASAQAKLDEANAKLTAQDAKSDAIVELVGDLRAQITALQGQIDGLVTISDEEKTQLQTAAAALTASATELSDKLSTEGAQLDGVLTPPAP